MAPAQTKFIEAKINSDFVSQPVEYGVLLPPTYDALREPIPLCLFLHGGGGSHKDLQGIQALIEACWADGTLPPMVFASMSAGFSMFMDTRDGSERWDSFIQGPFLAHLRAQYRVQNTASGSLLWGLSMGGHGAIKRYLRRFMASPLTQSIGQRHTLPISCLLRLNAFGSLLWDHDVPHEYHLVRWADHFGQTLTPRIIAALRFLATSLSPPQPEPGLLNYRQ